MMLSEALNSDTILNELKEVAQGPLLLPPQITAPTVAYYPLSTTTATTTTTSTTTSTPTSEEERRGTQLAQPQKETIATSNKHSLFHQQEQKEMEEEEQDDDTSSSSNTVQEEPAAKRVCMTSNRPFHRIPCKARGLSNKHNPDTAFFDIPVDAPHGLLLCCSHQECTASGRRFRYCKVCALPVAKRNFPKRHGHQLVRSAKDLKEVDYMCGFIDSPDSCDDGSCQPACEDGNDAQFAASAAVTIADGTSTSMIRPRHRRVVSSDANKRAAAAAALGRSAANPKTFLDLSTSEKEWLRLLHQRPDLEHDALMSSWMDQIITFTQEKEFSRISSHQEATDTAVDQQQQQQQQYFTPMSQLIQQRREQQRDTIVTPPLPESSPLRNNYHHVEQTTSSSTTSSMLSQHSASPTSSIEGQLNGFESEAALQHLAGEPAGVKHIMQNLQTQASASDVSEFVSGLDNVDMTNFFD